MRSKLTRRIAAALGLAVIFAGFSSPVPATAADVLHTSLSQRSTPTEVVASSGNSILVEVDSTYRLSTDNGAHWGPAAMEYSDHMYLDSVVDGKAVFTDYSNGVAVLDLATNTKTYHSVWSAYEVWAAGPQAAVGWNGVNGDPFTALPLEGGSVVPLAEDYPAAPPSGSIPNDIIYAFAEAALHLTDYYVSGKSIATDVNVMPWDGGTGLTPFRITGFVPYVGITGDKVEWVKRVSTSVSLCSKPLSGGSESCQRVATLASSGHSVWADRSGSVMRLALNGVEYVWQAGGLVKVTYAGSSASFQGWGMLDRPIVRVQSSTSGAIHEVQGSGATAKLFDDLTVSIQPYELDLSAGTLAGVDDRGSAWTRPLDSIAIGQETLIAGAASQVRATGGRTVLNGTGGLVLRDSDGSKVTATRVDELWDASGPFVLTRTGTRTAIRTHAAQVAATNPMAIFGSVYVGREVDEQSKPYGIIVDTAGDPRPRTFDPGVLQGVWKPDYTAIWGDRVSVDMETTHTNVDGNRVHNAHIYNYAPGQGWEWTYEGGTVVTMGDGVAVVYDWLYRRLVLWNFLTNQRTILSEDVLPVAVDDDNHLAYADDDQLVVTTVDGMGESAPRLLGTVAPASFNPNAGAWAPEFDSTKALAAGILEISHGSGAELVVDRVLDVPASSDGSIRGVVWNGKNTAGEWVPDGSYTWTLKTTDRADTAKPLVAIDGTSATSGVVTVKAANLGTVVPVTPKISDTTPTVDQTLTALPGTWKPTNPLFTYKWYRDTTLIKDATAATYLVTPADAGHTLKVTVTGSCPGTDSYCRGYASASKSSAVTATVAKANITPGSVRALDDTPTVDQDVNTEIGTWGPDPVSLSYQWYKVSSGGTSSAITNAKTPVFKPTGSEVGYKLKLKVTGSKPGYTTKSVYSALTTGKVAKAVFTSVADPTITGSVKLGMPLTAVPGATEPLAKASYQWYRGTTAISGATSSVYKTTSSDLGKLLKVRVTYSRSGYVAVLPRYFALTDPIAPGLTAVTPKLDDTTPMVGQTLKVTDATGPGAWNPADVTPTYQWYRGTTAITGQTNATYEVQAADVGKSIKVKVTGAKDGYVPVAKTSAASSLVVKGVFTSKPQPTIGGLTENTAHVTDTLTAVSDGWAPAPTSFTHVWYRGGIAITGATSPTYVLSAADQGKTITVKVTAIRSGFTSASMTSAPTLPIQA